MSLGFSNFGWWVALFWFAVSGPLASHVVAQGKAQPHRSIELSETNSAEVLTNLNQLSTKKDGFKQLDDQLRSLKGILSGNSMDRTFDVPYVSPAVSTLPNKALKELLDKRRNWGLSVEGSGATSSDSESDTSSLYGQDKNDNKKSSLKQFYDALNGPNKSQNSEGYKSDSSDSSNKGLDFRKNGAPEDDANLPASIRDKTQRLRELVNQDPGSVFNPVRARTSFDNFLGLKDNSSTHDAAIKDATRMESFVEQFKKVLENSSPVVNSSPGLGALVPTDTTRRSSTSPSADPFATGDHHELSDSTPGNLNSVLNQVNLSDVNATVLNQWNPLYTPPKLELPKLTAPTPPTMDFPRRRF